MPLVTKKLVLAAGASDDAMNGSTFMYLPWPAKVEIGITGSATGLLRNVTSGSDVLAEEQPVTVGTVDVFPVYPDHFDLVDVADAGDRLKVSVRNTTAGALSAMVSVRLTPLV